MFLNCCFFKMAGSAQDKWASGKQIIYSQARNFTFNGKNWQEVEARDEMQ